MLHTLGTAAFEQVSFAGPHQYKVLVMYLTLASAPPIARFEIFVSCISFLLLVGTVLSVNFFVVS